MTITHQELLKRVQALANAAGCSYVFGSFDGSHVGGQMNLHTPNGALAQVMMLIISLEDVLKQASRELRIECVTHIGGILGATVIPVEVGKTDVAN